MGSNSSNFMESQQKMLQMLVQNVYKKNGIQPQVSNLTSQQKQEIRNAMKQLQQQTQQFLDNLQQKVTENDVNPVTNTVDTISNRIKRKK